MPSRTGPPAGRISGGAPGRVPGGPPRAPGAPPSRPPAIVPRQAAGAAPAKPAEEEERGRRRKRFKKDVQVLEEGKPNRTRVITTKKRAFKEYELIREVQDDQTLTIEFEPRSKSGKPRIGKTEITVPKAIKRKIRISEAILVGELAKRMGIKGTEIIKKLMELGMMVTLNQAIDAEAASLVATEFGYEIEKTGLEIEDLIEEQEERSEDLTSPASGGHDHGACGPRQDLSPGRDSPDQRDGGRSGRHHPAYRGLRSRGGSPSRSSFWTRPAMRRLRRCAPAGRR